MSKAKKPRKTAPGRTVDLERTRSYPPLTQQAMETLKRSSSYPRDPSRDEITSGVLFRVFNERAFVDVTITYKTSDTWDALVRLSIDANNVRHRFVDTRIVSSESHEVWKSPREALLLAAMQMCVNRLGTFAEVEIAERERDRLVENLMSAGFSEAARKVGSW